MKSGVASYYHKGLHGNLTASGERYDHNAMTVAHRTLPFGTLLRVENPRTGVRAFLRVNDRGPFVKGRTLDVSGRASHVLGLRRRGTATLRYQIVNRANLPSRRPPRPRKVKHI